jgi:hypothetical protein
MRTIVRHRLFRVALGAVLLGAPLAAVPAFADPSPTYQLIENDPNAEEALNGLIAPIKPLMGGIGSTASIDQVGQDNRASQFTDGSGNLTLIQQSGANNRAVLAVQGSNSALLLVQGGSNNTVAQVAKGDNDFQFVGVSGHNNQVAYVQVGNELAGALNVTNATNTSVVAFQTPASGHYLMPTGISGLSNSVVVVVPGRMYVIPKKQ